MRPDNYSLLAEAALTDGGYESADNIQPPVIAQYLRPELLDTLNATFGELLKGRSYFLIEDDPEIAEILIRLLAYEGLICIGHTNSMIGLRALEDKISLSDFIMVTNELSLAREETTDPLGHYDHFQEKNYVGGAIITQHLIEELSYMNPIIGLGTPTYLSTYIHPTRIIDKMDLLEDDGIQRLLAMVGLREE